ncbi:MAG: DUF1326 domain-containing protein [Gemmatimonadaceae bacterium]
MANRVKWRARVEHMVACNCDWGCPCAFEARPTPGHCEGAVGHRIVTGRYGDVVLDDLRWVLISRWPGALHERGGRGIVYLDARAKGAKRAALEAIATGKAGGQIGILMSTVDAGIEVREGKIAFRMDGAKSYCRIPGVVDVALTPILNPVTGEPHYPSALLPTGLLVKREDYFSNKSCAVSAGELSMNHAGKNAHVAIGNWKGP